MRVFGELRRRNVFKVSIAYAILTWLIIKTLGTLSPASGSGHRTIQFVVLALILCFPVIVLFARAYEITPEGLRPASQVERTQNMARETGRKLNQALITLVAIALLVLLVDRLL